MDEENVMFVLWQVKCEIFFKVVQQTTVIRAPSAISTITMIG